MVLIASIGSIRFYWTRFSHFCRSQNLSCAVQPLSTNVYRTWTAGSAAVIGAVDLAHYNPEVITFGSPRAIVDTEPCTVLEPTRHYRFLNTAANKYDYAAFQINVFNEKHVGWTIFLDSLDNFPLSSPSFANNKERTPCSLALHEREIYLERIDDIISRRCFPLPVSKWPNGHYCGYDDECQSLYCEKKQCKEGLRV